MRGGKNPGCIFIGLIPQTNYIGSHSDSTTHFQRYGVTEMNISLNGNSVNGYPVSCKYGSPVYPYQKFLQTTGRYYDISAGSALSCHQFLYNWLWCHKFESESSNQGWIGVNFTLEKAFTENMMMIVWVTSEYSVTIDKFHQIERQ